MDPRSGQIVEVESDEDARERGLVPLQNRRARRAMAALSPDERVALCAGRTAGEVEDMLAQPGVLRGARNAAKRRRRAIRKAGGSA